MIKTADVTDPDILDNFANYLSQVEAQLGDLITHTIHQTNDLSEHWRDIKHQEFIEKFKEALDTISDLMDLMNEHSNYVHFKAEQLRTYGLT